MAKLMQIQRTVFLAPTAKRSYFTRKAAADAEARALIRSKYPTERQESVMGLVTFKGWHWSEDERLVRLHRRLAKRIGRTALATEGGDRI